MFWNFFHILFANIFLFLTKTIITNLKKENLKMDKICKCGTNQGEGCYCCCNCGTEVTIDHSGDKLPPCPRCSNTTYTKK